MRNGVLASLLGSALLAPLAGAPDPAATPAREPCAGRPDAAAPCGDERAVATVGGRELTMRDLDPSATPSAEKLDAELAAARREALDDAVDDALLELDAKRAKTTSDRLYVREVYRRVAAPTDAEIRAEHQANEQLRKEPLEEVRDHIAGTLRDRREARLLDERSALSRKRHRVVQKADPAGRDHSEATVLALVDEVPITWGSIAASAVAREDEIRWKTYRSQRSSLERAIRARLLEEEAARRGVAKEEVLRAEIAEKVAAPGDEEIAAFYAQNRKELPATLDAARPMILKILEEDAHQEAEEAFYERLKTAAGVKIAQPEPAPVAIAIPVAGPSRGDARAPVTLLEFGDFECRPCGRMAPVVEEILKAHPNDVRLVFRQLPLSVHPHARRAAEAAMAADALGGFWRYHAILYAHQDALTNADLDRYAAEAGLDAKKFRAALGGDGPAAAVVRDLRDSRRFVVRGTPNFFVNGVRLRQYGPAGLKAAVEAELERTRAAAR